MARMRSGIALVLMIVMTCAPLEASAADVSQDWSVVRMLQPGARLKVESGDGKNFEGTLKAVSDVSVTVSNMGKDTEIRKEDARRVYVLKGSVVKWTLTGTAIGAGGGAAFGAAVGGGCDPQRSLLCFDRGTMAAVFGVVGAVIGTAAGAVAGVFRRKRALVYERV
jgi:hypothetical protein